MAEDERIGEEHTKTEDAEVEGHGAKKVVGTGLAAAALVGAGVAGVKLMDGDDESNQRVTGALTSRDEAPVSGDLKAADRDGDGYLTSADLAHEGFKWDTGELRKHSEVLPVGLSLAGWKCSPELIGGDGFAIKGESIMLKYGVSPELDKLLESGAPEEWSKKWREIDQDGDGYAAAEDLEVAGIKMYTGELEEAGYKESPEDLMKAGYKVPSHALGEGGFMIKGESLMLKEAVDPALDELLRKD